jgi:hypothetical protein
MDDPVLIELDDTRKAVREQLEKLKKSVPTSTS